MEEKIIQEIKDKGIVKIDNFLDKYELSELSNIVSYYSAPKNDPKSYFPVNFWTLMLKILKLDLKRFFHSLYLWKIKDKKKLDRLAANFFCKKIKLNFIDAYYSKKSELAILPWHTDQAYHGKREITEFNHPDKFFLKIFIYLTDVSPNNGCMSYVPGSHKIGFAIRKAIYNKKIPYQPYWSLRDFKKILNDNQTYFLDYFKDTNLIDDFFKKIKDLDLNEKKVITEGKFSYKAKAGSAIIFDEGGVHQGSKPQFNDRMVLRYLYSPKKIT